MSASRDPNISAPSEMPVNALEAASESILDHFGPKAQMIKALEELGELSAALARRLNAEFKTEDETSLDRVVDECADVLIMAFQVRRLYGAKAVDDRIVFKLTRTLDFIRTRKEATV